MTRRVLTSPPSCARSTLSLQAQTMPTPAERIRARKVQSDLLLAANRKDRALAKAAAKSKSIAKLNGGIETSHSFFIVAMHITRS